VALITPSDNEGFIMSSKNNNINININKTCSWEQSEKSLDEICVFDLAFVDRLRKPGNSSTLLATIDDGLFCAQADCMPSFDIIGNQPIEVL
jgi:hypothetical protein